MRIEKFDNITIGYMRRTGNYGYKNKLLMESFKNYLKEHGLFNNSTTILGIALDNPKAVDPESLRYDVGFIINEPVDISLPTRTIDSGKYAVFELPHTSEAISNFWKNISKTTISFQIDYNKPIIERYYAKKIYKHLCEICIPLK